MSEADKSGVAEPEKAVLRGEETPDAENPGSRGWYRGDLNGAYQKWREGGKPEDPTHPLTKTLLLEARLYAGRIALRMRPFTNEMQELVRAANEKSILRAMALYDPNQKAGANFTTYFTVAVKHNITQQRRRVMRSTHQEMLRRAHNGDREAAHWWIDEEKEWFGEAENGLELLSRPLHVKPKDRPLAHWLVDQDPKTKITWRHVLGQFPEYKTEDTAGRALRRVKKAIENDGISWTKSDRKRLRIRSEREEAKQGNDRPKRCR